VLGKRDTLLLRDILRKEGEMMDSSFAILCQALILQEKQRRGPEGAKFPRSPVLQAFFDEG